MAHPHSSSTIRFYENGLLREIAGAIRNLKKENNEEFLYTMCGSRISLNDILSVNGVIFH